MQYLKWPYPRDVTLFQMKKGKKTTFPPVSISIDYISRHPCALFPFPTASAHLITSPPSRRTAEHLREIKLVFLFVSEAKEKEDGGL